MPLRSEPMPPQGEASQVHSYAVLSRGWKNRVSVGLRDDSPYRKAIRALSGAASSASESLPSCLGARCAAAGGYVSFNPNEPFRPSPIAPMLARADTVATIAEKWLAQFERALAAPSRARLETLFHADSHWRDVLALTWHIKTVSGAEAILRELGTHAARPSGFRLDPHRTAPRNVRRAGTDAIEAIFRFETAQGRGSGVLRLTPDAQDGNAFRAWTLLTALDEIKGHEERLGSARPQGKAYSRDFRGPNWLDLRKAAAEYAGHEPAALVVGGGQAGLSIAARLAQLGVDTLIVDREARIGDNWRKRYHALVLHNQVHVNHLPYMTFPPNWPTYIPKDKLAAWFEAYVESMELNYWTAS